MTAPAEPTFTKVAEVTSHVDFRHFALPDETYPTSGLTSFTQWLNLEQGKPYPIKGYHVEYTSSDHFTVGLEQEDPSASGHSNARKTI